MHCNYTLHLNWNLPSYCFFPMLVFVTILFFSIIFSICEWSISACHPRCAIKSNYASILSVIECYLLHSLCVLIPPARVTWHSDARTLTVANSQVNGQSPEVHCQSTAGKWQLAMIGRRKGPDAASLFWVLPATTRLFFHFHIKKFCPMLWSY